MKTTQVNPETRPELFNLGRDLLDEDDKPVAEVDPETGLATEKIVQVYDVKTVVDKTAFVDYDLIKRKSAKGVAEFRAYNDNAYIYHEIDGVHYKLAHQEVFLEYLDPKLKDKWVRVKADLSVDSLTLTESGDVVKAEFNSDTGKQTFTVAKQGFMVSCVWVITRFNEYDGAVDDLKIDFSDYDGNIDDSDWVEDVRTIVFESKGVADVLVVDPYISVVTTSTTITVEFDSSDEVVWTISTENATLKENTPVRAVIHEDYFEWTVYDEYMVRWQHDTAASTTGAAFTSNTYCTDANKVQIGAYDYYFYPATSANNTAKTTLAAELADISTGITTGTAVTDMHWPGKIASGTSGACYDGAFHLTSDANNAGKLTIDRDRALMGIVIEDWPVMTGDPSAPDEYLTTRLKCGDDAASSTVTASTGANGNWEAVSDGSNRNTNSTDDSVDGASGDALDTQNGTSYIDMSLTGHANDFFKLGTIKVDCKPQFSYDDAADQTLFHVYVDANNYLLCWYDAGNDRFEFTVSWGSTAATVNLSAHTTDGSLQVFSSIWCAWDSENDSLMIYDGNDTDSDSNTGTPSASNPTKFTICAMQDRSLPGDFILDDVVTLDGMYKSFGSFIPGDIIHAEEYDRAHSDVTFFWDGSDCTSSGVQIGEVQGILGSNNTGGATSFPTSGGVDGGAYFDNQAQNTNYLRFPVTSEDIIDWDNFSIGFWLYCPTVPSSRKIFAVTVDSSNYFHLTVGSTGLISAYYVRGGAGNGTSSTASIILSGTWQWIELKISPTNYYVWVDSSVVIADTTLSGTWAGTSGYIYLGADYSGGYNADVWFSKVTITSSPSTPAVSTINGKPILLPHIKSEVA